SERHKDIEILLLRQQLRLLQRVHPKPPQLSRWEKLALAVLAHKLMHLGQRTKTKLDQALLLFKPATELGWHRELLRRKWTFPRHHAQQMMSCDFFTVETAWLRTLYVFFFLELGSRRVHFAGCTAHPTAEWVTQQARQLTWTLQDGHKPIKYLIRDRDAKFT